jgi:DNA-binding transcriptional regulator YiaG
MNLAAQVRAAQLPPPSERQAIRKTARLSLRRFGRALGVSDVTVLRWERGDAEPTLEHAVVYRELLDELRRSAA